MLTGTRSVINLIFLLSGSDYIHGNFIIMTSAERFAVLDGTVLECLTLLLFSGNGNRYGNESLKPVIKLITVSRDTAV